MSLSSFCRWAILFGLAGCAQAPVNHTVADADPLRRAIVDDVVNGVSDILAPSGKALAPSRTPRGAFDNALRAALRSAGYAIAPVGGKGIVFDCVVDALGGNQYRVNVRIGDSLLSRLWVRNGTTAYTGGAWTRRE
jgi:hypothetical protein